MRSTFSRLDPGVPSLAAGQLTSQTAVPEVKSTGGASGADRSCYLCLDTLLRFLIFKILSVKLQRHAAGAGA